MLARTKTDFIAYLWHIFLFSICICFIVMYWFGLIVFIIGVFVRLGWVCIWCVNVVIAVHDEYARDSVDVPTNKTETKDHRQHHNLYLDLMRFCILKSFLCILFDSGNSTRRYNFSEKSFRKVLNSVPFSREWVLNSVLFGKTYWILYCVYCLIQ